MSITVASYFALFCHRHIYLMKTVVCMKSQIDPRASMYVYCTHRGLNPGPVVCESIMLSACPQ